MNYCKKCSRLVDSDVSVCPFCGNNLGETGNPSVSPLTASAGVTPVNEPKEDNSLELSPQLRELSDLMSNNDDEEKTVRLTQDFNKGTIVNQNTNVVSEEPKRYTVINPTPTPAPTPTPTPPVSGAPSYGFTPVAPTPAPTPTPVPTTTVYTNDGYKTAPSSYPARYDETVEDKEVGLGLRIFLYFLALVAPVIATIVGIVYINKPGRSDKIFGQSLVIITCILYVFIILGICGGVILIQTGASIFYDSLNSFRYFY